MVALGGPFTCAAEAWRGDLGPCAALVGMNKKSGIALAGEDDFGVRPAFTTQPLEKDSPRDKELVVSRDGDPRGRIEQRHD